VSKRKPLDPSIKEVCSRIYKSDPKRFKRLITWVKTKQKAGYTNAVIADSLKAFEPYKNSSGNWWPYLSVCLAKVYTMAKQSEAGQYKSMSKRELTKVGAILRKIMGL